MDFRGQWVQFKVCDVYHPDPTQVLLDLHGNDLLTGKVLDVSDSGSHTEAFVVVEVAGMAAPIVVPVECLFGTGGAQSGPDAVPCDGV
jgi:hypothetical protein